MSDTPEILETDIAVVGLSLRVPGAATPSAYWHNVRSGLVAVRKLTEEELKAAGVPAHELADPHYVRFAAPIDGVGDFDPEFFGFGPKEGAILDPQHRHLYECAWEALEDAGHPPEKFDGAVGVFTGCGMPWYFVNNVLTNPGLVDSVGLFLLRHTGNDKDFLATRVSYAFDLKGPSVNVQTACSSSLVAIHLACQSLLSGECDMALAGGVTLEIPHGRGYVYKEGEILAPDGVCRPFDKHAAGTVFGSGAGVVVLRRLVDAIRDRDPIRAVIKGSAVNNDGSRKVGYLAPSVDGQAAAIVEALAVSGCAPETIAYVEAHGTGTAVGDPIEVAALTEAFRRSTKKTNFCGIGSVKANIGHLDTAAGVASFAKAVLALQAAEIPPTPNFTAPNATIDFAHSPFYVADKLKPWPKTGTPRRAGVTSLGVGGTNAHVVIEEAPVAVAPTAGRRPYQLLCLSARTKTALEGNSQRLREHLSAQSDVNLADAAWTLHVGRRSFGERRVLCARDSSEAIALLESRDARRVHSHTSRDRKGKIAFLFPGGGAQHLAMGAGLFATEPVYREIIERGIAFCRARFQLDLAPYLSTDHVGSADRARELLRPSIQLPAIFLVEYALAKLWMHYGVEPKALIGHSMGENTAACIAEVASFEDTLMLVRRRGELFERVVGGGMLSIAASPDEITPLLGTDLDLATVNAPTMCVVSGPTAALDAFATRLSALEIETKVVPISIAAHSRLLVPILDQFLAAVRAMKLSAPKIPFISNLTGTWITNAQALDPQYWVDHLRSTVRFAAGLDVLLADEARVLVEVGPGKVLSSLSRLQSAFRPSHEVIATLRHPDEVVDDAAHFVTAFGRLWAAGCDVALERLWHGEDRRRIALPTYAFDHRHCWIEPGRALAATNTNADPEKLPDVADWFQRPVWREEVLDAPTIERAEGQWLVFADRAGVCDGLAQRLRARGATVAIVRDGDAYGRLSDDEYLLSPEQGREGYDALLSDLAAHGRSPQHIVHAWLVTQGETFRPGSSFFHRNQEHGFYSLLFLAQAIADQGATDPLRLFVVSNGMARVGDEVAPHPEKATVLGPVRVIPRELTHVMSASIDLNVLDERSKKNGRTNGRPGIDALTDQLETEIVSGSCRGTIAWRHGRRFVERFDARPLKAATPTSMRVRRRGVYLLTGGLGGIGLTLARWLATEHKARLILLSRSGLPERAHWPVILERAAAADEEAHRIRTVMELESLGSEVMVANADVTDVEGLERLADAITDRFGELNGAFHAAGVLRDGLLQERTLFDVEEVFAPKVHGTLALETLLDRFKLDFTVVFSSTSAWLGAVGQIDYCAANAFLDAWAESRTSRGHPTLALAWGIWNSVGMAARAGNSDDARAPGESTAKSPLFATHRREPSGLHIIDARWSAASLWMIDEHRTLAGRALLPGTGYIELARAALIEIGESRPFDIEDLVFVEALFVPEDRPLDVRVLVRTGTDGHAFEVRSRRSTGTDDAWVTHAEARLVMRSAQPDRHADLTAAAARTPEDDPRASASGTAGVQAERLRFGPRWSVLRSRRVGAHEAFARLALDARFEEDLADHALHPALLDVALHIAVDRIPGHGSDLWVPMSFDRVRVLGPLASDVRCHVKVHGEHAVDADMATFDAVITNPAGLVLLEVEGFALKRLRQGFADGPETRTTEQGSSKRSLDGTRDPSSPIEAAFRRNLERGIQPHEGVDALTRLLASTNAGRMVVSSLSLEALDRQASALKLERRDSDAKFERPTLASEYVAPRDEVESRIVEFWVELLGVDPVGIRDDFFQLGGHSLIAVRLFTRIKKAFHVEFPISVLFEAPTIERCADLVRAARTTAEPVASGTGELKPTTASPAPSKSRFKHLVAMHSGEPAPRLPFFLVAGMFGNVLNLRHLAHLVGGERPFYGIQARGLYGEDAPHETFEEMAAAYLAEVREVQPQGPYHLGGFSGGGIAAFEMARQLLAAGEEIASLVMLDTPLPKRPALRMGEKMQIHVQRARKQGFAYFPNWVKGRVQWKREQEAEAAETERENESTPMFHSRRIQAAFNRALELYDVKHTPVSIALFRPKLDVAYVLGKGRLANVHRELLFPDNGWTPVVDRITVHEVPGDHDSMVLEPNVRVLAQRLRRALEDAERTVAPKGTAR
ncbi:MAG: SDR family NAD(P)-dependent oxidoreductase [Planctomycetes bacterium]|nr:SDR family NAD(P)-dependent oxidoreductase [Planctomycetota bacterium]